MQAIFEKKEAWDIVDNLRPEPTIVERIRKKDKDNAIATKIIK